MTKAGPAGPAFVIVDGCVAMPAVAMEHLATDVRTWMRADPSNITAWWKGGRVRVGCRR